MRVLVLSLVIIGNLFAAHTLSAQTIKLGTVAPDGSPWHSMVRSIGQAWSKASGGSIQLRIYAGGNAGDEPDLVRKMQIGQLHAAMLTGQGLTQIVPDVQALQMPLMLTSDDELDYAKNRLTPKLDAMFEAKGFKVLSWGEAGWVYFFAQKPAVYADQLRTQRIFAWAGDHPIYVDAWRAAGYNPVSIPVTELLMGLQSGLVHAFAAPPISALAFQWFGLAKNMTDLKWAPLIGATIVSIKAWQEVPEHLRPIFRQVARDSSDRFKGEIRKFNHDSIEIMKKHGLVVHHVPSEALGEWEQRARAAYQRLIGNVVSAQMVREVERLRDEYRRSDKLK